MIDIVQMVREQHPDLGPYVLVLREPSGLLAPEDPDALAAEVVAWSAAEAPGVRLSRRPVTYAASRNWPEETRHLALVAFPNAGELARFAARWTG
ncbi:hypothetical protein [uncultured Methylobacterium sp.]|jgi:hypothetical protein|uniref:hypothetical protein n=1 Tax=uncultured Methylobacterium sp. TaxID=157278 RepID=UPI00263353FD|nr:hypothetical protein [uncultured Methylobacterium sp.]